MKKSIAIVMDPIERIKPSKDTSFALLLEAQRRGYALYYIEPGSLSIQNSKAYARLAQLTVNDVIDQYFKFGEFQRTALASVSIILMRKDPPFDDQFLYDTQILSIAEGEGVMVVNNPQGLRDMNEKLAALQFPQCCPETLVSRSLLELKAFIEQHRDTVVKPLDGMGGKSIFRIRHGESNVNVILETLTGSGNLVLAQKYIPEIT